MEAFLVSALGITVGELGDKTQILTLVLAARFRRPAPIILAVFLGTLTNHGLACLAGEWFGSLLNLSVLRWVLGISFLAVAVWALMPEKAPDYSGSHSDYSVFVVTFRDVLSWGNGRQDPDLGHSACGQISHLACSADRYNLGHDANKHPDSPIG